MRTLLLLLAGAVLFVIITVVAVAAAGIWSLVTHESEHEPYHWR